MRFEINRPAEPQTAALVAQKHVSRGQYYHVAEKKNCSFKLLKSLSHFHQTGWNINSAMGISVDLFCECDFGGNSYYFCEWKGCGENVL